MSLIILSGEVIFMLPFMIPRLYRPLMLEGWGITNTDLGIAFFAYGITAMFSYAIGGLLVDKYQPRILISFSLALTGFGSLFLLFFHSAKSLIIIYAFFGVSTILMMWGALIKTTHLLGGEEQRSAAMGFLDGGRGLVAALASSSLIFIVSLTVPHLESSQHQLKALNLIYISTTAFTFLLSTLILLILKDFQVEVKSKTTWVFDKALECLKNVKIWLLGLIVLSSYCGYKNIDNYSIYMVKVLGQDLVNAAKFTAIIFWLRPVVAILTGVFVDQCHKKNQTSRFQILFLLLLLSGVTQLLLAVSGASQFLYVFTIVLLSATFTYALRALYFSVFGDLKIQNHLVGTTVGIVSFVGFLPDIFFGYVTGRLIDLHPGALGFQYTFLFTAACLFVGAVSSYFLYRLCWHSTSSQCIS